MDGSDDDDDDEARTSMKDASEGASHRSRTLRFDSDQETTRSRCHAEAKGNIRTREREKRTTRWTRLSDEQHERLAEIVVGNLRLLL